jgi:polysaccharide pyruvyl transferase WcaK-like protein
MGPRAQVLAPDAKIAFVSPCGWGNLGDAAIVESLLHGIRVRIPRARVVAFTLNPADTAARHGVEAHTCAAYSLPFYPVKEREDPPAGRAQPDEGREHSAAPAESLLRRLARAVPVPARALAVAPVRMLREPAHLARSRDLLGGASLVVVAGGGQLDGVWGGALGHPYVLWRWGRLAASVGARFAIASVGTGTLSPLARVFVRRALALADYRSFRDARSRELVRAAEASGAPIVPDLAYALPVRPAPPPRRAPAVVGLSPMNYCNPRHWPRNDVARYRSHVRSFGGVAARLLTRGHEVVLFTTDRDTAAANDTAAVAKALAPAAAHRLRVAATPTVERLLETLADVHVVVAARLHGVLLSHVALRPVLAVSHERKVRTLMEDTGHARYCLDIEGLDAAQAEERLLEIIARREALTRELETFVARCRSRIEAQYDALLGRRRAA